MAGVPGTGLGGIFYVMLVLWMGVRESWLTLKGRTDDRRWRSVAELGWFASAIVAVFWLEGWALKALADAFPEWFQSYFVLHAIAPAATLVPFAVLAALMLFLYFARIAFPLRA